MTWGEMSRGRAVAAAGAAATAPARVTAAPATHATARELLKRGLLIKRVPFLLVVMCGSPEGDCDAATGIREPLFTRTLGSRSDTIN
jgi:hypothetical protein